MRTPNEVVARRMIAGVRWETLEERSPEIAASLEGKVNRVLKEDLERTGVPVSQFWNDLAMRDAGPLLMQSDEWFDRFWNDLVTREEQDAVVAAWLEAERQSLSRWADENRFAAWRLRYLSGIWPRTKCLFGRHLWVPVREPNIVGDRVPTNEESCRRCKRTRNRSDQELTAAESGEDG